MIIQIQIDSFKLKKHAKIKREPSLLNSCSSITYRRMTVMHHRQLNALIVLDYAIIVISALLN